MHEPQPIPRRENTTKTFDDDLIARTLRNAADIRRALRFSKGDLFLDADGRSSDPEQAAQASTYGCLRLASMAPCPDDSLDARDLRWHAATRFQRRIGYGIETYDNDPNTTAETVAADLEKTAAEVRNPAARYTAEALEKAGHPEAAERLYYILKELADDPDEVPVSQASLAHLAGFIATTTLPPRSDHFHKSGRQRHHRMALHRTTRTWGKSWDPRHPDTPRRDHPDRRSFSPGDGAQPDSGIGPIQQARPGNASRRAPPADDP